MNISFKLLVFAVVLISCFQRTAQATAPEPIINEPVTVQDTERFMTIPEVIHEMSTTYGVNEKMLSEVIFCESSFRQGVSHDGGQGVGVTGFHRDTFDDWNKRFGLDLNYYSSYDQVKLMAIAFTKGENYRDDWSSYRRYVTYGTCDIAKIRKMLSNTK